ncbi:MAG: ECF transporter S component [Candidatus Marinimicrobia bacterium]|nr:ECF transporter S component [Candidatus Neomarinimicrobiota bacterium]
MTHQKTRRIAFSGMFIALILGVGYALAFVPNVELITAMIFLSGVLMGIKRGMIIGVTGEFLFSALNPMGSGLLFPPLLIAQLIAMALVSLCGGLLRRYILNWKISFLNVLIIGVIGFILTLFYDIIVSSAFPLSAGFTMKEIIATIIAGLAFSIVHLVGNTLVFILLVPIAAQQVYRAIPFFQEFKPVTLNIQD